MTTLYGIKNCDTIKKARAWLNAHNIEFQFHDYRVDGLDRQQLILWCREHPWENILNRRGTTWRKLAAEEKETIDESSAIELMLQYPAMIKRPILDLGERRVIGFSDASYQECFLSEERQSK